MNSNRIRSLHLCCPAALLLVCLTTLPAAAAPDVAYKRSETRTARDAQLLETSGPSEVNFQHSYGVSFNGPKSCTRKLLNYNETFPPVMNVSSVSGVNAGSQGWSSAYFQDQKPHCGVLNFTNSSAVLRNMVYVVHGYSGENPVAMADATCVYKITGVPVDGILRSAGQHGVYGVGVDGSIVRKYFSGGQSVVTDVIASWGAKPVVGSLVVDGTDVCGVNENGKMFCTWTNNSVPSYAVVQETADIAPASLVLSNGNGMFGVTTSGGLFRAYYSAGWQVQSIHTWSGKIVPGSLVAGTGTGANAEVYGVNENGKVVSTWRNNGVVTYNIIAQTANVAANSLAVTNGKGVFGVTTSGGLLRTYWDSEWKVQAIPTWGGKIVPGSLISGGGTGDNANVLGVNEHGKVVGTWLDNGVVTYTIIDQTADVAPNSLVVSNGNGIFGVTTTGGLFRLRYGGSGGPGWNVQNIATSGGGIVQESLIAGTGSGVTANVYGVNEFGKVVKTTGFSNGSITYSVLP